MCLLSDEEVLNGALLYGIQSITRILPIECLFVCHQQIGAPKLERNIVRTVSFIGGVYSGCYSAVRRLCESSLGIQSKVY